MKSLIVKSKSGKGIHCALINKHDPELKKLMDKYGMSDKERDDLVERQRPNALNFDGYSIITLSFPTKRNESLKILQMSMIVNAKELIILTDGHDEIINNAFGELLSLKNHEDVSSVVAHFIDSVREESIKLFDGYEELLTKLSELIITGKADKQTLASMQDLRANLFYIQTALKGNIDVTRELLQGKVKYVKHTNFGEHQDDREVYFLELIQSLTELTRTNIDLYTSRVSEKLNEHIYKLTIIGAILLIPTIISGYFGMNVILPEIGFIEIVVISIILSIMSYYFIRVR